MVNVFFVSALPRLSDEEVCVDNAVVTVTRLILCWQSRPVDELKLLVRRNTRKAR